MEPPVAPQGPPRMSELVPRAVSGPQPSLHEVTLVIDGDREAHRRPGPSELAAAGYDEPAIVELRDPTDHAAPTVDVAEDQRRPSGVGLHQRRLHVHWRARAELPWKRPSTEGRPDRLGVTLGVHHPRQLAA